MCKALTEDGFSEETTDGFFTPSSRADNSFGEVLIRFIQMCSLFSSDEYNIIEEQITAVFIDNNSLNIYTTSNEITEKGNFWHYKIERKICNDSV
jgi:hypothetical protein